MTHDHDPIDPASIPQWVAPPYQICRKRLLDEARYLHLTIRGLGQLALIPELIDVLERTRELTVGDEAVDPDHCERAQHDAAWVQSEADADFPLLHAHAVVGLWSSLEVLCEDTAATWLDNVPDAWKAPEVARLKIPLATYAQMTRPQQIEHVVSELARACGADLKTGAGRLRAVLKVFGLSPRIGENVVRALHELGQVRNVLVHRGGLADDRLVEACPWLGLAPGTQVRVDHALYGWYYRAAHRYVERVMNQVLVALGHQGCTCPGADEIEERPT